jgi:hypothetical protein
MSDDHYDPQGYDTDDQGGSGCGEQPHDLPHHPAPERRARVCGYSWSEAAIVGRWLEGLLEDCPAKEDAPDFWKTCQIVTHLANPVQTQAELVAKLGFSQQYVSQLLVKIQAKLSRFSSN